MNLYIHTYSYSFLNTYNNKQIYSWEQITRNLK
jgi:hypothetical protein